jgi:hypothetical protein
VAGRALTIDITTKDQQTLAALKRIQRELGQLDKSIDQTAKQGDKLGASADEYAQKLGQARQVGHAERRGCGALDEGTSFHRGFSVGCGWQLNGRRRLASSRFSLMRARIT